MTVTVKNIIPSKRMENAQTTQYTAPTGVTTIIDEFTVTNTTGGALTFSVNLVTLADTAAASNLIISARAVAAGETYLCPELNGKVLASGGFISTIASAATSLTMNAAGREIT